MKTTKYPAKENNETKKSEKTAEARSRKRKLRVKTAVSLLNTNFEKLFVS